MDWTRAIDGYCERLDASYWAEPINALTNLSFILVALFMWSRVRGLILGQALVVVLAAIGVGSYLFHTHAQTWAAIADVTPILLFILIYLYVAIVDFWGKPAWMGGVGVALFIPYAIVGTWVFDALPFFQISAFYWPVPVLIFGFAVLLRQTHPTTSKGLALGAALLCVSLTARSLDMGLCRAIPVGTHFLWHVLNGVMLGWMIEVYRRHMLATGHTQR